MQKSELKSFILSRLFYVAIGVFVTLFFMRGCKSENVQTPKKGTIVTVEKIKHIPIKGSTEYVKGKTITVYKNNEINKELALENYNLQMAYINAKDSLEKEKLYRSAVSLNKFNQPFENDYFKANASGIVQGEIKNMQLDYELRKLPVEKVKFRMLLGVGFGIDKDLKQGLFKFNAGYQNSKGNIIKGSYMKIGNESYGLLEYDFSLFKITK